MLSRYEWDGQPQAHRDVADIGDPQSFQCLWLMLAVSLLHNIAQVRVRGSARRFVERTGALRWWPLMRPVVGNTHQSRNRRITQPFIGSFRAYARRARCSTRVGDYYADTRLAR